MNKEKLILPISILMGSLILGIFYFSSQILEKKAIEQKEAGEINQLKIKKDDLKAFFTETRNLMIKEDYQALYGLLPENTRECLESNELADFYKRDDDFKLSSFEIKDIKIEDNIGRVSGVYTFCKEEKCIDENKKNEEFNKEFYYLNSEWSFPPMDEPSEEALEIATKAYLEFVVESEKNKKDFFDKYSRGRENLTCAIRFYALRLENDKEQMVYVKELLNKVKNKKSSNTTINMPSTTNTPAPNSNSGGESILDKLNRERDQKCQEDMAEYNSCLNEYNTELAEYNACLSETSDPNSWRYNGFCSKPYNHCLKPYCAY